MPCERGGRRYLADGDRVSGYQGAGLFRFWACTSNLSRLNVKLRQFQIESVNFVSAQVTDEDSRAVGGNIAPGTSGATLESGQGLQIGQKLRASLADLDAPKSRMVAERNVEVKIVPVGCP